MKEFPVLTLCGSMRFFEAMLAIARDLTEQGNIVLAPFVKAETPALKTMLDTMHLAKIAMSDAIYVVNINGYVGESTRQEIAYALAQGKMVLYHENQTSCYVKENGKPCQLQADHECKRCHKPICDVHSRDVEGFFVDRRFFYCPDCYERHLNEREDY